MEKMKEFYEAAEVEVVLFEFSDIVTASNTGWVDPPSDGDIGDWA